MLDPKTEELLKSGAYKYHYEKVVQLKDIDLKTSMENPTRLVKQLNDDKVLEYALKMEAKRPFTALLLLTIDPAEKRPFKYEIATGCHRVEAANMAGVKVFDAYVVVEADAYRRELLCRLANTIEGTAPTMRDNLLQICEMHVTHGKPFAELVRSWIGVKLNTVQSFWNEEQAVKRAQKYGFDPRRHKISRKALQTLAGIHSEPVFEKAMKTILNFGTTSGEIEHLARDIKKHRDEATAKQVIDDYIIATSASRVKAQAKLGRAKPTKAIQLRGWIRAAVNMMDGGFDKLHLDSMPDSAMFLVLVEDMQEKLKSLKAELEKVERINRTGPEQPGVIH